jgi:methionyl-tRNA formyltransferase
VTSSPVKQAALDAGLPVLQPARLRHPEAVDALRRLNADFIVVAAYGLLVPPDVLELPRCGVLNIHPSLLPRHRGASPIPSAILNGDDVTGVSIMLMDEGLDTGPVLSQREVPIGPNESAAELSDRLAAISAHLLIETIEGWMRGRIEPRAQDDRAATYSPQLKREDGRIDWTGSAENIWRQVRAMNSWPGAETTLHRARLHIWRAWPLTDNTAAQPGTVTGLAAIDTPDGDSEAITVKCGEGSLALLQLQKEGRKSLSAPEFARGERNILGARLGA